jgi:hypothetical protein
MTRKHSKYWTRETAADLSLPDGHKMRNAIETRRPEWVREHPFGGSGDEAPPMPDEEDETVDDDSGGDRDGVPDSRLLLMHDDWPGEEQRLRTARIWRQKTGYDPNHVFGLASLIDQLAERQDELPPLLCSEFVDVFETAIEAIFTYCSFQLPDEDSIDFPEYSAVYLEPALEWLLNGISETFE